MKSVVFQLFTVYTTFFLVIHSSFRLEAVIAQIYTILIVIMLTELANCDVVFEFSDEFCVFGVFLPIFPTTWAA